MLVCQRVVQFSELVNLLGWTTRSKRHITVPWAAQETPIPQVSAMLGTQLSQSILSWLVVSKMFIFSHSTGTMIPDNELPFFSGGLKAPNSTLYYLQWDRFMRHLKIWGALPPLEGCSGVNLHVLNYIDICPLFWMRGVDPANVDPVQISHGTQIQYQTYTDCTIAPWTPSTYPVGTPN